jgi:hypothetical protein
MLRRPSRMHASGRTTLLAVWQSGKRTPKPAPANLWTGECVHQRYVIFGLTASHG